MGLSLIASDIPPHRELTPNAQLIDPLDGLGWLAAIERATKAAPIPSPSYRAPSWTEHFRSIADAIGLQTVSPLASAPKGL